MSGDAEGQIVLIQAAESRRHFAQCFALYSAVLLSRHPSRAQSLFHHRGKTERKVPLAHLRSAISSRGSRCKQHIHAQCFTGMSLCEDTHVRTTCPFKPPIDYYRRPLSEGHQPPSDYQRPTSDYTRSSADYAQSRRPSLRTKPLGPDQKMELYGLPPRRHMWLCRSNCREVNHGVLKPASPTNSERSQ